MNEIHKQNLFQQFHKDIDDICLNLIKIFNIKFDQKIPQLSSPLLRWLDFRLLYVESYPRLVLLSDKFPKKLPADIQTAFNQLCDKFQNGEDVNPYQSETWVKHHDISGNKKHLRTDLLWADWGIHHFHLTSNPLKPGEFFSKRSNYQAFCAIDNDIVRVIDVRPHPKGDEWGDPDLLEILVRNWPNYCEKARYKTSSSVKSYPPSNATNISKFRKCGVNMFLPIRDNLYMPIGLGLTSASTPFKLHWYSDRIISIIDIIVAEIIEPNSEFKNQIIKNGNLLPNFHLKLTKNGIVIQENNIAIDFILHGKKFEIFYDLLCPKWALAAMQRAGV